MTENARKPGFDPALIEPERQAVWETRGDFDAPAPPPEGERGVYVKSSSPFTSGNLGIYHLVAAIGAFAVAVVSNFLWNRYWTFGPGDGLAHLQAARFFAVSLASLGLNLVFLEGLLRSTSMSELTAQAIAVAAAMPFNFLGNKLWTFT